jgi:hypothetical protein
MSFDFANSPGYVENRRLREAFTYGAISAGKLAEAVGIMRTITPARRKPDGTRKTHPDGSIDRYPPKRIGDATAVKRDLGLVPNTGRGTCGLRRYIKVEKALLYADVLGLDPADLGL